ncbi:MAG: hypothetical protein KDD33_10080, partial [Bdellovibrionales bacterium]|nr:hypothetical protein [Bdellovibrionales bacterium]
MQPRRFSWKVLGLLFLSSFLFCHASMAGQVVKTKGKKIYIKLNTEEAESLKSGDFLFLLTPEGKKKAIVQIKKMKGKKVLAQLKKGKAQKGYTTRLRKGKKPKKKEEKQEDMYQDASQIANTEDYAPADDTRPDLMFGLMAGYGMASQSV